MRCRSVATAQSAREWLTMHSFDALFIDSKIEDEEATSLLELAWKHNSLMLGGVFNFYGSTELHWHAKLLGAKSYFLPTLLDDIRSDLINLPVTNLPAENFHILLVEDLDTPRHIICSYVEALGYPHIDGVGGAKEALERLTQNVHQYSCVMTDVNMPNTSGIELLQEIRRTPEFMMLPVIVLTAYSTVENLIACVRAGATGFLVKPPRKAELRQELEKAKRIWLRKQNPRLCRPEDANRLEDVLVNRIFRS